MGYEFYIARRHFRAKRRTGFISVIGAISLLGVTLGVAALVVVMSVMNGFQSELKNRILGITAHLVVLKFPTQPMGGYRELINKIRALPEVVACSPFIYTKSMISQGSRVDGVVLRGVDPTLEAGVTDVSRNVIAGSYDFEERPGELPGLVLGVDLADRLESHIGDTLTVASPMAARATPLGLVPKARRFRLAGIFDSGMYEYNSTLAYISLGQAQDFLDMGGTVSGLEVKVKDIYRASEVGRAIVRQLGPEYRTSDWMHLNWNLFSALKLEKVVMFLILALVVMVAAFNIVSSLIMTVMEKVREIGVLKSVGATSGGVMRIFVIQGLMTGAVGTALGLILGLGSCLLLKRYQFIKLPADVYFIDRLPVQMQAGDFLLVAGAAMAITLLATLYPSWKAARLDPVEAIRYE
jgi:lipoprotein-releasing system permease protein